MDKKTRIRLRLTRNFKARDELTRFLETYTPNFSPVLWDEFRLRLVTLWGCHVALKRETNLNQLGAILGAEKTEGDRYYVPNELALKLKDYRCPGELVEIAFRLWQAGRALTVTEEVIGKMLERAAKLNAEHAKGGGQ